MNVVRDVVLDETESIATEKMLDVRGRSGDEVVHADDFMTAIEEKLAKVRAEEAGTARDQGTRHYARPLLRTSSFRARISSARPIEAYVKPRARTRFGS